MHCSLPTRPTPLALAALALCSGLGALPAAAQSTANDDPQQVMITARKRPETLTQTPAAISAFNSGDLEARNINTLADIGKLVPNLDINRFGVGNPSHAAIFIRGIGLQDHIITTDPGVGVYLDGVYLGRQMGANLNLSNITRVEVLRGPQGTLYGKNTLGGAINIITAQPGDEKVTRLGAKLGTLGRVELDGYTNYSVNDALALSFSGDVKKRNGIGKALQVSAPKDVGEEFEYSARAAAKLKVSKDFSLLATVDGLKGDNGKSPTTIEIFDKNAFFTNNLGLNASQLPANPDDSNSGQAALFRQTNKGVGSSLTANWRINDQLSAKVLTSVRYSRYTGGLDDDNTKADLESFPETGWARQWSIEPQLNGEFGQFDFVAGLYSGTEKGNTNSGPWVYIGPGGYFDLSQQTRSSAAYGHAGYQLTDALKISGGLRFSRDAKQASAQFDNWSPQGRVYRDKTWTATTWDVSAAYDLRKGVTAYGTVSTGYQSGGYPPRPFSGANAFVAFDKTKALNIEAGLKGSFFDKMLSGNLSVFHTRYTDLPLQVSQPSASGFNTFVESAGKSTSQGVEVDGTLRLTPAFSVQTAIGYIHARITDVPASATTIKVGYTPPLTPSWTAALAPSYRTAVAGGSIDARMDISYRDNMWGQSNNNPVTLLKARTLVGLNIAYTPDAAHWTLALYGQNIFNKVYDVGRLDDAFAGFADVIRSNDRREIGLKATYTF
jgi:iron complex outermembrane receptor protein